MHTCFCSRRQRRRAISRALAALVVDMRRTDGLAARLSVTRLLLLLVLALLESDILRFLLRKLSVDGGSCIVLRGEDTGEALVGLVLGIDDLLQSAASAVPFLPRDTCEACSFNPDSEARGQNQRPSLRMSHLRTVITRPSPAAAPLTSVSRLQRALDWIGALDRHDTAPHRFLVHPLDGVI